MQCSRIVMLPDLTLTQNRPFCDNLVRIEQLLSTYYQRHRHSRAAADRPFQPFSAGIALSQER